ncbi:Predicted kinase, aminoglycoside phosphotransferase (APT) family [Sphingobium faniae]|nr:Predicted kinase, aminoglycoside phosphotransferase (APT) family [Sphingobium faniae]
MTDPIADDRLHQDLHSGESRTLVPLLLRSIDATLETKVSPEIRSDEARTMIDIIRSLLYWSVMQLDNGEALRDDRTRWFSGILGITDTALPIAADKNILEAVIAGEAAFYKGFDPESVYDPATAYQGGKSMGRPSFAAASRPVDAAAITNYLRTRFRDHPDIAAENVVALTGGMSKDTILFDLSGGGEALDGGVVLRKDLDQRGSDYSSIDEYSLLQAMYDAGLPLAEPLWSEPDDMGLGTAFIAVRKVGGQLAANEPFADEGVRRHFVDRLANTLVRIHQVPLTQLGLYGARAGLPVSALLVQQIEEWRDFWRRSRGEPDPAMDFLLGWMEANIPPEPDYAASVVHGDYGFHNLMTNDGEVSAILDWEFAHPGDPMEDVAYTRQFVEPLGMWQQFLKDYEGYGGAAFDPVRGRYFEIWQNVRNACLCAGALRAFSRGTPGNLRMAAAGISLYPRFKLAALRQISAI